MSPSDLANNLGYGTLFVVGVLGNMGVPVPEKTVLLVAGYMIWAGRLEVFLVMGLGLIGALIGANLAYWLGRTLGQRAIDCCAGRSRLTADRMERVVRLVGRYGCLGIFASRFIPGVRFLANTTAGIAALAPLCFSLASACAALAYLPLLLGAGYLAARRYGSDLQGVPHTLALPLLAILVSCAMLLVCLRRAGMLPRRTATARAAATE